VQRSLSVTIAGLQRELPLVKVPSGAYIAYIRLLGDTELVVQSAKELVRLLPREVDLIIAPETGGIVIAHQMSLESGLPYVIVRKKAKPYMKEPIVVEVRTISDEVSQKLLLSEFEAEQIRGKRVVIVDEVVSTGSTLEALTSIVERAGGRVLAKLAIATEGASRQDVMSLCHLPVFDS
jgi:adenine phosphoribosyltransferase